MIKEFCKKNKYSFGTIILIITSILLGVFVFSGAYLDLGQASKLTWEYILHLFKFNVPEGTPAPPLPQIPENPNGGGIVLLPENSAVLVAKLRLWGLLLINSETYTIFFANLIVWLMQIMTLAMIIIPTGIFVYKLIKTWYMSTNTNHGKDTLPLKCFKEFSKVTITPTTSYAKGYCNYLKENKIAKLLLITIWVLNLNIISIILPLLPFYFYFCFSFDFTALYEILKYTITNTKYIAMLSPYILVPVIVWLLDKWRRNIGLKRLQKFEAYNENILKGTDIISYKVGTVGTGKTKNLTQDALTISVIFTKKACELMFVCRQMFPQFPWLLFELDIEKNIKSNILYSWVSCLDYVVDIELAYKDNKHNLFGYDVEKYGLDYYNGIAVNNLFKVLADYARLHFLYIMKGSFILSNYSIREDKEQMTEGNTTRWDYDFFNFDKDISKVSYLSKILNFDMLRMGMKINDDPINEALEFGIICIAEDDKEQKNAVEAQEDSQKSPYANPKNDGVTRTEKFIRHRATIMGYCFAKILKDGQRVMSINADTRELCTIEHMLKSSKEKNTLPFFFVEKTIFWIANKIFVKFDDDIRYYRGDNTLIHYILKYFYKKVYDMCYKRVNRYGYTIGMREIEDGTLDKNTNKFKIYQCNAKIFSDRYRTDSHAKFFEDKARKSKTGIVNMESYGSTTMSDSEFEKQNSYSRLDMTNPKWKQAYIDKANAEKEKKKAIDKANAKKKAKEIEEE